MHTAAEALFKMTGKKMGGFIVHRRDSATGEALQARMKLGAGCLPNCDRTKGMSSWKFIGS
jgi:hypothetical protein